MGRKYWWVQKPQRQHGQIKEMAEMIREQGTACAATSDAVPSSSILPDRPQPEPGVFSADNSAHSAVEAGANMCLADLEDQCVPLNTNSHTTAQRVIDGHKYKAVKKTIT